MNQEIIQDGTLAKRIDDVIEQLTTRKAMALERITLSPFSRYVQRNRGMADAYSDALSQVTIAREVSS